MPVQCHHHQWDTISAVLTFCWYLHCKLSWLSWTILMGQGPDLMIILNTLRPRQNVRHFTDNIFKCIFLNENVRIQVRISLKYVPKGPFNNIPALVQIMAWHRSGDKPLSEPMVVGLPTHICVTRPQWVKVRATTTLTRYRLRAHWLMMTSSNGNITGHLWGESTSHRWILLTKASDAELWCFHWSALEQMVQQTINTPVIWDAIMLIMMSL